MVKLLVKNDFHDTVVEVVTRDGRISRRKAREIRRRLCGVAGCTCGGTLGQRGPRAIVDAVSGLPYELFPNDSVTQDPLWTQWNGRDFIICPSL